MPRRDSMEGLRDMLVHAREAVNFARGKTLMDAESDRGLYLILSRLLEIIGEAANRVPREEQARYPGIEWVKAVGMRNFIAHGYDAIEPDVLWDTVRKDLPPLIAELEKIVRPEEKK